MGRQTLCGPQPAKITVVSLFVFNRLFPHNWGGLFRSAFWFVWWNLQEIYHGFDKSRTMWVFQHKLFFFENFWNPVEGVNSAEDLVTRLEKFSKFKQTDQSRFLDAKIIKRWKLLNFLFSVREYSIGNTTCSPENVFSHLSTRRRRWISCLELARSIKHSAQERGKEFRFHKSNWTHIRGKLLVRSRICCCKPCLKRNWQDCELKVCLCTLYNGLTEIWYNSHFYRSMLKSRLRYSSAFRRWWNLLEIFLLSFANSGCSWEECG